mmetsp:Transcript_23208/g.32786  ORF Transcript_23208/g.32786 Transcript_23208/m.32786 type:complete len:184 (-) Transcript_23208:33-584(-)|eukprot:CAMPEP_0175130346 /NCGR_PEP_ID=MMETSP0087-20121206/5959_1 /TAXON_ID=136419 /ORGANISM="Unknown Unknown, Strain D1" /LENGTH=183 /DNA_ID=CAMNT_0016412561 /DNA_START=44 /DNA_END=595 /DNA_ORIENTATION=+
MPRGQTNNSLVPDLREDEVSEYEKRQLAENIAYNKKTILYVGGLDEVVDEEILMNAFIPFGDVINLVIPKDPVSERHRGFCFVEYEETEDAAAAMDNMNDSELHGRVLKVNVAKPNAIKNQAVWAQADQWLEQKLAKDSTEINAEIRQTENTEEKEPAVKKQKMMKDPNKTTSISRRDLKSWA